MSGVLVAIRRGMWAPVVAVVAMAAVACGSDGEALGENQRTVPVSFGDLITQVSVNGSLVYPERAALMFGAQGTVSEVLVQEGQRVAAGQPLARLDSHATAQLEADVAKARIDLRDARDALARLTSGRDGDGVLASRLDPDASTVSAAQLEYEVARKEWDVKLDAGQDIYDEALAEYLDVVRGWLGIDLTEDQLDMSPAELVESWGVDYEEIFFGSAIASPRIKDIASTTFADDPETPWSELTVFAWRSLFPGRITLSCPESSFSDVTERCVERELETAWETFSAARSDWEKTQAEAALAVGRVGDPLDLALKQAEVAAAESGLEDAVDRLDRAVLKSPWEGIVTRVNVSAGDDVTHTTLAVEVADPSVVELHAIVDEIDVLSIREGLRAEVSMDALPGPILPGTVSALASAPQSQQGVVSFPIRIRIDLPGSLQFPEGLTAVANVIIQEERGVLKVPLSSVRGNFGEPMVLVMSEGKIEERPVALGTSNEFEVVIEGGLQAGEQVVVESQDVAGGGFGFGTFGGRIRGGAVQVEEAPGGRD